MNKTDPAPPAPAADAPGERRESRTPRAAQPAMETTLLAHQASPAIRRPPPWTRRLATELAGMLLWSALALLAALALDVRHALAVVSLALAAGTAMALLW